MPTLTHSFCATDCDMQAASSHEVPYFSGSAEKHRVDEQTTESDTIEGLVIAVYSQSGRLGHLWT